MQRQIWALVIGAAMVVVGVATYVLFHDVETPVLGLRQTGAVVAVLGVADLVATGWSMAIDRRSQG